MTAATIHGRRRTTRLPGGGALVEHWDDRGQVRVGIEGEVDAFDRAALVDAFTAMTLEGALVIDVDADRWSFGDSAVLHALAAVSGHLGRRGGRLAVNGLPPSLAPAWSRALGPGG